MYCGYIVEVKELRPHTNAAPAKDTIITVTISEYTNNINQKSPFRKVTKYFNAATNTWQ